MQTCGHWWVKTARKLLFIHKSPQVSEKVSASWATEESLYLGQQPVRLGRWWYNFCSQLLFKIFVHNLYSQLMSNTFVHNFSSQPQLLLNTFVHNFCWHILFIIFYHNFFISLFTIFVKNFWWLLLIITFVQNSYL